MARVLVLLACLTSVAHADTKTFASGMQIDESAVIAVQEFAIKGSEYRRAIVGRYNERERAHNAVVLEWCDTKLCWTVRTWLGPGEVETLGIVDLGGEPAAFPTHPRTKYDRNLKADKMKWPALLVRTIEREETASGSRYGGTVSGVHRRTELYVVSLLRKDEKRPAVLRTLADEHWPTGAGVRVTFAVGKDGHIVATERQDLESRSACIRPKPVTVHYKLDENRMFRKTTDLGHRGCGSR